MHPSAHSYVTRAVRGLAKPPSRVLEIGSLNVNGTIRDLFSEATEYVGIDILDGDGVDIVADGATFARPDGAEPFDCVVCCEVLEHADVAANIVANAHRLLGEGGVFLMTCAGTDRYPHSWDGRDLKHGEFYRNVSSDELRQWLRDFTFHLIEEYPERGDLYAIAYKR